MRLWDFFKPANTNTPAETRSLVDNGPDNHTMTPADWRELPKLTSVILRDNGEEAATAAKSAARIITAMSPALLPLVDERVRSTFWPGYARSTVIHNLLPGSESGWAVLALISSAPNGHTREAA